MKLGLIGCGKMGGALLRGALKASLVKAKQVTVFDKIPAAIKALQADVTGLTAASNAEELAAKCDVILLAVKPQDMQALLETIAGAGSANTGRRKAQGGGNKGRGRGQGVSGKTEGRRGRGKGDVGKGS